MDINKISTFLIKLRKENQLTQKDLSEKIYVSREAISKWERGICIPEPSVLILLSELYKVSINEILYGEKLTEENKDKINNQTANILASSEKRVKKLFKLFLLVLISIVFIFLSYYFINNYKSIKVYMIAGEGNYFDITEGILITSPSKSYLQLGNIINNKNYDDNFDSLILYYQNKNNKEILLELNDGRQLIPDISNKLLNKNNIKKIIDNLYIDITSKDYKETIKLSINMNFENNFSINKTRQQQIKNISISSEKVLSKFKLIDNKYIYKTNNFEYELNEEYIYINEDKEEKYIYYYKIKNLRTKTGENINLEEIDMTSNVYIKNKADIEKIIKDLT